MRSPRNTSFLAAACLALGACSADHPTAPGAATVAEIAFQPGAPSTLHIGAVVDVSVGITYEGTAPAVSPWLNWVNSNPAVIRFRGATPTRITLEALQAGTSTISASLNGKSASLTVTVHAPGPAQQVFITNTNLASLSIGTGYLLNVTAVDSENVGVVVGMVTYTSSDSNIVQVTPFGVLRPMAEGSATVSARMDGKSATAAVIVVAPSHAFLWTPADGMRDLGVLPGYYASSATAISATGSVAGNLFKAFDVNGYVRAFRWTAAGGMVVLDLPSGALNSQATAISASGEVAGFVTLAAGFRRAVVWNPEGGAQLLGVGGGDLESQANGINDNGDVVGWTGSANGAQRAFLAEAATGRGLLIISAGTAYAVNANGLVVGTTGGVPFAWGPRSSYLPLQLLQGDNNGTVLAVSSSGDMVGLSGYGGCDYYSALFGDCDPTPVSGRPVLWSSVGTVTNLQAQQGLAGRTVLSVTSVNSARQVIGAIDPGHAFIWSSGSGAKDLGVLPHRTMSTATAINDAGQVAGWSGNP